MAWIFWIRTLYFPLIKSEDWPLKDCLHRNVIVSLVGDFFVEKLAGLRVEVSEVTQSEQGQKQKLQIILTVINRILQQSPPWTQSKWSVDSKSAVIGQLKTKSLSCDTNSSHWYTMNLISFDLVSKMKN